MNPNLLYSAARKIASQGAQPVYYFIDTIINSPAGDVKTLFTNALFHNSDYVKNFTSEVEVRVGMTIADYRKYCWTYRDNLHVTINITTGNPTINKADPVRPPVVRKYRAVLLDNSDPSITRGNALTSGTYIDGTDDLIVFYLQLIDEGALKVMTSVVGGLYPMNTDNGTFVRSLISNIRANVGGFSRLGMTPVDVTEQHEVTLIPHDIHPAKMPLYVQQQEGGLYRHGCGSFIIDDTWWIYPPYDLQRYQKRLSDKLEPVLEIYQVPTTMVPTSESTWQYQAQQLQVICTGSAVVQDISVGKQLSEGNGTRYIRADRFMNAPTVNRGNNTSEINRSVFMAEFKTSTRADGIELARLSSNRITANDANEISKLAMREGQIFKTTWQNSRAIEYLNPGMPVRVNHDKGNYVSTRDGVLIGVEEAFLPASQGIANRALTRATGLTCFIGKNDITGAAS